MTKEQTDKEKLYADMLQRLKDNTTIFENFAVKLKGVPDMEANLRETVKLNREIIDRAN